MPLLTADRPRTFPNDPNPPAEAPDAPSMPAQSGGNNSSAGTGALPPENSVQDTHSQAGATPLAPAPPSATYSVVENDNGSRDIFAFSDAEAKKIGSVTLGKEDADPILKASGAIYDKERGTYDNVPEATLKALSAGRPAPIEYWKEQWNASEAEAVTSSNGRLFLDGKLSGSEVMSANHVPTLQAQLANRPDMAWTGKGGIVSDFLQHPLNTLPRAGEAAIGNAIGWIKPVMQFLEGRLKGAAIGAAAGLPLAGGAVMAAGGPENPYALAAGAGVESWMTARGATVGSFMTLQRMESGAVASDWLAKGLPEATVKQYAPAAGAIKAAMWMGAYKYLPMPAKQAFLEGLATKPVQSALSHWAVRYAGETVSTGALMATQSAVSSLINNMVASSSNRPDLHEDAKTVELKMLETGIQGIMGGAVMGVPGTAKEAIAEKSGAVQEAALAGKVKSQLEGVPRLSPGGAPSPSISGEIPLGEKTQGPIAQKASLGLPSETPQAPAETTPQTPAWKSQSLTSNVTEHPGFVKALEQAKEHLPPGMEPTNRAGVVNAYLQAAKESHDYFNQISATLGEAETGKIKLTPDEKNQLMAHGNELMAKMGNLRDLAQFMRDPEGKADYLDRVASGEKDVPPPIDPYSEATGEYRAVPSERLLAEQKLEASISEKGTEPKIVMQNLNEALEEGKKAGPKTLEEKTRGVEEQARVQALNTDLSNIKQRIGELASTRDRMEKNGVSTRAIDRQLSTLFDQRSQAEKDIAFYEKAGATKMVEPTERLEMKPATLEDIVNIGFKEGTKQSQTRARELLAIAKENGLTAVDVKKLIGNRSPGAMGDVAYRNFVEGFERVKPEAKERLQTGQRAFEQSEAERSQRVSDRESQPGSRQETLQNPKPPEVSEKFVEPESGSSSWSITDNPNLRNTPLAERHDALMREEAARYGVSPEHPSLPQWVANRAYKESEAGFEQLREISRVTEGGKHPELIEDSNIQRILMDIEKSKEREDLSGARSSKASVNEMGLPTERVPGFKEGVAALVEQKKARAELASVIKDRQIEKEQYVRQLNNMPPFHKMTTEQLRSYADILRQYDKADTALSPKRIAALKGTVLEGIKTEGEARTKAAQLTGRPIEDFQNVRVPLSARAIPDPHLRTWYPALRPFVDLAGEMSEKGERLAETVKSRNEELATAAIRERRATMGLGAKLADWFAPQQKEVMDYLEAKEPNEVAAAAAKLTPAELKWGDFLKSWFGTAEDYLVKKEGMESRFSGAYAPHVNRAWPEILRDMKEQGLWSSLKEFMPQAARKTGDFVDQNGQVLGFNKFFKQTMFRSGELVPSENVVSAANRYIQDFYRKAALDQTAPVLDTLAKAMKPPEGIDPKEAQAMTSSLEDFTRAYINNKKGINNSAGAMGELFNPVLRMSQTLASIHWIAANYALQAIKGSVAIPISEYMALGTDLVKAKALKYTEQGSKILAKYQSFTGPGPFESVTKPGADVGDFMRAVSYGGFQMAHKAAMEDILLGSMTKEEYAKGEISDARLNEIRQGAGRWLDLHGSDSIFGSSQVGKTLTQYKGWAIPPLLSIVEDANALKKMVMSGGKEKMTPQQTNEALRLTALAAVVATAGTTIHKEAEDDSFTGQSIHYLRRAMGSMWRGLDPAFFFTAAGPGYVAKLANDLSLLMHLEKDKEGNLKGAKALGKDITPRIVKDAAKMVGE